MEQQQTFIYASMGSIADPMEEGLHTDGPQYVSSKHGGINNLTQVLI